MIFVMKKELLRDEFSRRLIEALDDIGVPVRQRARTLARWVGKNEGNPEFARKWLKSLSIPQKDNLTEISLKLGVREEWLEYGVEPKAAPKFSRDSRVSDEEKDFLDGFRSLPEDDQEKIRNAIRVLGAASE